MPNEPQTLDQDLIARANLDLAERLFKGGVEFVYDEDGDTLFVTIGAGANAITKHVVDGVYARIDPETLKIVGCTLLAFESDLLANNKLLRKLFLDGFQSLRESGDRIVWEGAEAAKTKPLFELVLAR